MKKPKGITDPPSPNQKGTRREGGGGRAEVCRPKVSGKE